jgi:signal transduction histidine kinase
VKGSYPRNISIVAAVFIFLILFLAIINFYVSIQLRKEFIKYDNEKVVSIANLCAGYIEQYNDYITLRRALKRFNDAFNLDHMMVLDTLGNKLYDSKTLVFEFNLEPKRVDLSKAFKRLPLAGQLIQDNDMFVIYNTEPPFYLYASLAFSYTSVFDKFFKWYIFYITISLLFLGFLGLFLIRNLFLPMRYVARLADDMGVEMKREDFVPATFNEIYKKIRVKEEALIEFSSYVAHEFRNSIAAIIGLARLVEKGKKPAADIALECRLMENLINRLLEYAQPLKAVPVRIQVDKLIGEAIERTMIPKRIKVNLNISDDATQFVGDHDLISAALSNLLQNSVAAIVSQGTLDIESRKKEKYILITIQDSGQGMSEQTMTNIFKPFYSEVAGGMGLGLAYVKKIIEMHNGKISVESKKDKGAKFTLYFPIEE